MTTARMLDHYFYDCFHLFFKSIFSNTCTVTFLKLFHLMCLLPHQKHCCANFVKMLPKMKEGQKPKLKHEILKVKLLVLVRNF